MDIFRDRTEAGQALASMLGQYQQGSVVYALPRGGVETGAAIAEHLKRPLKLIITRKIGHPYNPEYAIGAVTETGPAIWNELEVKNLEADYLARAEAAERAEAKRRRQLYQPGQTKLSLKHQAVILTDDGVATGLTMAVAINELKAANAGKIIVAVPVIPIDTLRRLSEQVDKVIYLLPPEHFLGAVGAHYQHFPQLSDQDVIDLLKAAN